MVLYSGFFFGVGMVLFRYGQKKQHLSGRSQDWQRLPLMRLVRSFQGFGLGL
jgi:hypothetical protein